MAKNQKPRGWWTKERCAEEALNFETLKDFQKNSGSAYQAAHRNKWLEEICSHMERAVGRVRKPKNFWTKARCSEEALKFKTLKDFREGSNGAYNAAYRNKWLDEICSHMEPSIHPKGYWTKPRVIELAQQCKSRDDFRKKGLGAIAAARKAGWLDEINEMVFGVKRGFTKKVCHAAAQKYTSLADFRKHSPNKYRRAKRKDWLSDICQHMQDSWSLKLSDPSHDQVVKIASTYETKMDFMRGSTHEYWYAYQNNLLTELFPND